MKNMKKSKTIMALAAMAVAAFSFTSCDEPYERHGWNDPYGWYNNYNDWSWNNNDWNDGTQDSQDTQLLNLANTLMGEWYGSAQFSYLNDDGESRTTKDFNVDMKFFQYGTSGKALCGQGIEEDIKYADDGTVSDSQTLTFNWYIDDNGDIYIKYDDGGTYVMDGTAKYYGYYVGYEKNNPKDVFYGYMIGIGQAQGKLMYIDLTRVNTTSNAKGNASANSIEQAGATEHLSFGMHSGRSRLAVTVEDGKLSRNR